LFFFNFLHNLFFILSGFFNFILLKTTNSYLLIILMRFTTLGLVFAVIMASMVNAAPTTNIQTNMDIDSKDFKAGRVPRMKMNEHFETFSWKTENERNIVDRVFQFELNEPAELQITDFMMGKYICMPFISKDQNLTL
jgi:ABC-type transporter MlaC component